MITSIRRRSARRGTADPAERQPGRGAPARPMRGPDDDQARRTAGEWIVAFALIYAVIVIAYLIVIPPLLDAFEQLAYLPVRTPYPAPAP
jgi:hypothetical protein